MENDKKLLNQKIVLYGYGSYGKFVHQQFLKNEQTVHAIIDDYSFGGETLDKVRIYSLDQFVDLGIDFDLILITSSYHKELQKKLYKKNLKGVYYDIFRSPSKNKITKIENNQIDISFYTPNYLTRLAAENFLSIEPDTIKWIDSFEKNSVFYDVGASNGCFSIYSAFLNYSTEIFALEPCTNNFSLMVKNINLNKAKLKSLLTPLNFALDSSNGNSKLNILEDYEGSHSKTLVKQDRIGVKASSFENSINILTFSLDSLIINHKLPVPNYLKIDVDGAEFSILCGSELTLNNNSLKQILIETEQKNERLLIENLSRYGFDLTEEQNIYELTGERIKGVSNYLFKR